MFNKGTFFALLMLAFAVSAFAQNPLPGQLGYDAWKISQIPAVPVLPSVDEAEVTEGPVGSRSTCDCWIEPDATYTLAMLPNDDGSSALIPLPFAFSLYGDLYTSCYINNNGNITFDNPAWSYGPQGFPDPSWVMVAPFWSDVDTRPANGGEVWYKVTPTALYVNWVEVGYYGMHTDKLNTFQVIITDGTDPVVPNGANVSFCYKDMQWTTGDASGGSGGFGGGGFGATVGANKGDGVNFMQFGKFDHAGVDYDGAYGANDGVSWLDQKHLLFTTDQASSNSPPVITSQSVCDSMVLCVGELASLNVQFLAPEPDQINTATTSAPTLSNWTITNNIAGLVADISVDFTPLPADIGYHTVTFSATDNGSPVLTSTLSVIVHVIQGGTLPPGSLSICDNGTPVDLLVDVMGPNAPAGGSWTDPNGAAHGSTFDPVVDPPGDYLYAVLLGGNCASLGTASIVEVAHAWAGNDAANIYCSDGAPVDLFTLLGGAPQATGTWTSAIGQPFAGILDPTVDGTGNYTYVVTGAAPCPNDTSITSITVNQYVDAGLPNALTLCEDAVALDMLAALNGAPTPGGTWTAPNGTPWGGSYLAAVDPEGIYTYTVTSALPCLDHSTTLTLAMDPAPWAGDDGSITKCANDGSLPLFPLLSNGPDLDGVWIDPTQAPHNGTLNPPTALTGAHAYVVYGTGACTHLIDTSFVAVTINPLPRVAFVAEPDSGCHPLRVTLFNTTPLEDIGANCMWDLGDGDISVACDSVSHLYLEPGWYPVRLTVTSPLGCTHFLFEHNVILVEKAPEAIFLTSPNPGFVGNSTLFFNAQDLDNSHYGWTLDGSALGTGQHAQQWFTDVIGSDHEICLDVTDRYGCVDTLCQAVSIVVPAIFYPNAFTPDGDGVNDKYFPRVLDVVAKEHLFQVFDRWGEVIFTSTDPTEGWDGSMGGGGEVLPQGVYVWRLETLPMYAADKVEFFGSVTLIK